MDEMALGAVSDFEIFMNNILKKREFHKRTVIYKQESNRNLRTKNEITL